MGSIAAIVVKHAVARVVAGCPIGRMGGNGALNTPPICWVFRGLFAVCRLHSSSQLPPSRCHFKDVVTSNSFSSGFLNLDAELRHLLPNILPQLFLGHPIKLVDMMVRFNRRDRLAIAAIQQRIAGRY